MGALGKQLRPVKDKVGQDRTVPKTLTEFCGHGKFSGSAKDVSVTKSECSKRLTACVWKAGAGLTLPLVFSASALFSTSAVYKAMVHVWAAEQFINPKHHLSLGLSL